MSTDVFPSPTQSLYELRESKNLRPEEVAVRVSAVMGLGRKLHYTAICQIEERGTNKSDLMDALAAVYDVSLDLVKSAAKISRASGRPERVRRSPKNT